MRRVHKRITSLKVTLSKKFYIYIYQNISYEGIDSVRRKCKTTVTSRDTFLYEATRRRRCNRKHGVIKGLLATLKVSRDTALLHFFLRVTTSRGS